MTRVYICAPYRGSGRKKCNKKITQRNIDNAKRWARELYDAGKVPIVPHLAAGFFDDDEDRQDALLYCVTLMSLCDEMNVYGTEISPGMKSEIEIWKKWKKGNIRHIIGAKAEAPRPIRRTK